jgi:DNA-binding Lrp family transcriptional regulator
MSRSAVTKPEQPGVALDSLDHAILRALARAPRASFADVGARLGVHERTIARRLERMTATGEVRFTASLIAEHLGEGMTVELEVRCAPGRLDDVGRALARRRDTRSVEVSTGEPVVVAETVVADNDQLLKVVDTGIGRMDGVRDVHSSVVLRLLLTANDWAPYDAEPTPIRRAAMEGQRLAEPLTVDALDRRLVDLLQRDARMPMTRLAAAMNMGESTVRRRLTRLMSSHVVHLRLFAEPAVLGFPVEARFQLEVVHSGLDAAIRQLAAEPSIRHLVITTGRTNVFGYSSHRTVQELHAFTERVFAGLTGLRTARTALLVRTYKRAGRVLSTQPAHSSASATNLRSALHAGQ